MKLCKMSESCIVFFGKSTRRILITVKRSLFSLHLLHSYGRKRYFLNCSNIQKYLHCIRIRMIILIGRKSSTAKCFQKKSLYISQSALVFIVQVFHLGFKLKISIRRISRFQVCNAKMEL